MIGIDETLMFQPLTFAVLTVSDTRDDKTDKSGNTLADRITTAGHRLKDRAIVKDEAGPVSTQVRAWVSDPDIQVILTTGGTGLTGRDVTVEAVAPLFEKTLRAFQFCLIN